MAGSKKISWEALDQIKEEKSSDWFWIVGIVAVSIVILAVFFNNLLFALVILLATFTSFMLAHTPPKITFFEINRKGIVIGEVLYPYSTLESFYVIDEDGYDRDRIILKSKKFFMTHIVMPIGDSADPEDIREYLIEYLNEEEMYESFFERLFTKFGF